MHSQKKASSIQYGYRNVELMRECFPKHSRMGTTRMKEDKEIDEGENKGVSMEISKAGMKGKRSCDNLSIAWAYLVMKYAINEHLPVVLALVCSLTVRSSRWFCCCSSLMSRKQTR